MSVSVLSRLRDPEVSTAAFLVMMGMSIWIESPVIDLLSTSTTLATDRARYRSLRRFAVWLIAWVTAAHAAVALTPLYWTITLRVLGVPLEVAEAARLGMIVMIPWSGFIGWRRFRQGVLIRNGKTRLIGLGTGLRLSVMASTAAALALLTDMPGVQVAALSLVCSVAGETAFVHLASRRSVAEDLPAGGEALGTREMLGFHLPLTGTTMVQLAGTLIVGAALARAQQPVLTMAAWQVASAVSFLHRTVSFALPEVVITLYKDSATGRVLLRFCLWVGGIASGTLLLFALTGLDVIFFRRVLGATEDTARLAHIAYLAVGALPLIGAAQGYARGVLTAHRRNGARLLAVFVSVGSLTLGLVALAALGYIGVATAAGALTLAYFAELCVLAWAWVRARHTVALG